MPGLRALIIEDDSSIRSLVRTVVQREGFQVDVAVDGQDGLNKLDQTCYNLVLLDLMMPKVDGYEVMERLKVNRPERLKRIIVMTAVTEAIKMAFPEPVCMVLPKPFDIMKLRAAVHECADTCRPNENE